MMIVGEAWSEQEELYEAPFVGSSGFLLRRALSLAGVDMDECYLTNVFNFRPQRNDIETLCATKDKSIPGYDAWAKGKWISAEHSSEIERLWREVHDVSPNVILALGSAAVWALCNKSGIAKHRGFVTEAIDGTKVVSSWHPGAVLRNYSLFPVLILDVAKAVKHDHYPEMPKQVGYLCVPDTIAELEAWVERWIEPAPIVICDIETENDAITEVGFSVSQERVICIPFYSRTEKNRSYWSTFEDELAAWTIVRRVCETKPLAGQNFAYDMKWLWKKMGIRCPGFIDDTMLMHHSLQPEMEKGLSFLASAYTDRPAWKFMRAESKGGKKGD